jgi:hypothetical protein
MLQKSQISKLTKKKGNNYSKSCKSSSEPKKNIKEESFKADSFSLLKLCSSNSSHVENIDNDESYLTNKIKFQDDFLILPFNKYLNRAKIQVRLRRVEKPSITCELRLIKEQSDLARSILDDFINKMKHSSNDILIVSNLDTWNPFIQISEELKWRKETWLSYHVYIKSIKKPFITLISFYMADLYLNKMNFLSHKKDHDNYDHTYDDRLKKSCLNLSVSLSLLNQNFAKLYSEVIEQNLKAKNEFFELLKKSRINFTSSEILRLCIGAIGEGSPFKLSDMSEIDFNSKTFNDKFSLQTNDMLNYSKAFLSLIDEIEKSPRFMENRNDSRTDLFVHTEDEFELQDAILRVLIEFIEGFVDYSENIIGTYLNDVDALEKEINTHLGQHEKYIRFFTQNLQAVCDNLEKTKIIKQTLNGIGNYSLGCLSFNEFFMIKWLSLNEKQLILRNNLIETIIEVDYRLQIMISKFKFNLTKKLNDYFLCDKISWKMNPQEKEKYELAILSKATSN